MFENKKSIKYGKIKKYDGRYGTAAGSGEPGSSLYGMKDFKSKTTMVNPGASSTLNSIYGIKDTSASAKRVEEKKRTEEKKTEKIEEKPKPIQKPLARTASDILNNVLNDTTSKDSDTESKSSTESNIKSSTKQSANIEKRTVPKNTTGEKTPVKPVNTNKDKIGAKQSVKKVVPPRKTASSAASNSKATKKSATKTGDVQKSTATTRPRIQNPLKQNNTVGKNSGQKKTQTSKIQPKKYKKQARKPISKKGGLYAFMHSPASVIVAIVFVAVLYLIFRVPLSKLGGTVQTRYGITENSGILVNNTDISTLSNGKLKQLLGNGKLNTDDKLITIKSQDGKYVYTYGFDDFDVVYDVDGTLEQAGNFAKDTESPNWWREVKALESGTVNFDVIHYNKSKVNSTVRAIAKEIEVPSVDATVLKDEDDDDFSITPSSLGYTIDTDTILTQIDKLISERNFGQDVVFQVSEVTPKFNEANFNEIDNIIGSSSSEYSNDDEDRVQNLRNACEKLNGIIVYPDEEFSTNEHLVPFTEENGWRNAGTVVNGKIEDSLGGGMCQISSGLYDALLEAEVEITERHNHAIKVSYVDYGMDASLAGDYEDLCFKNDTGAPLYIEAYLTSSNVVVNIYGKEIHDSGRRIEFESKFIESTPAGDPIITYDDSLPEGTEVVTSSALDGLVYELYKNVYENGELVDTVLINTSYYASRSEEKTIGTGTGDSSSDSYDDSDSGEE